MSRAVRSLVVIWTLVVVTAVGGLFLIDYWINEAIKVEAEIPSSHVWRTDELTVFSGLFTPHLSGNLSIQP